MRQALLASHQPYHPPANPHGAATVRVSRVQTAVLTGVQPAVPYGLPPSIRPTYNHKLERLERRQHTQLTRLK